MLEDFDDLLNRCLADIVAGRETIDSCLRRHPAQADRLATLLELAERVQAAPVLPPLADDKRRTLETQLLKRAAQLRLKPVKHSVAPRLPLWRRSFALAIVSLITVTLLLGTTMSASATSVPGDVLYPVKRATEQVRLALTPEEQQVDLHLEFARQRLQEMNILQTRGEVSEDLLAEMSTETALVLKRVPSLPQDKQQVVLMSLTDFQDQELKALAVMVSSAQGEARTKVMNALADSATKQQQAKALLVRTTPGATPGATPVLTSTQEPEPTVFHGTQPVPGKPTSKPAATDKPAPQATVRAVPKVEHTPPGQANQATPGKPTKAPRPTKEPKK